MSTEESRSGWQTVRFGDVVREVKKTTKDPAADGFGRVVGLDHLDRESLHLRRWDELADLPDGTSFTRTFRAGQVLFGKRRAYQRKVAVADFDGVCSSDILVFEPSTPDLLPAFLPYLVQSNGFFDHALGTSAGSLSPRTKWQELAKYEFALPPLDEQERTIELLAGLTGALETRQQLLVCLDTLIRASLTELDGGRFPVATLEEVCSEPITYGIVQAGPDTPGGVPYVRVSDMTASDRLEPDSLPRTTVEIAARYRRSACSEGDLIFALRGPIGLTRVVPAGLEGVNLTQGTARLSPDRLRVSTDFLQWALQAPSVRHQFTLWQKGSTFQEVSLSALRKIKIPLPPPEIQASVVEDLGTVTMAKDAAVRAVGDSNALLIQARERFVGTEPR